ncbi:L,D-transpeptidase [Tepidamorphus sp. 3E244]|uniref:L,D-transpeptidase n=1 Tax=Tepidamorphus sp. 3E244 TaxID=3385498 RepID=UPI0038FCBB62
MFKRVFVLALLGAALGGLPKQASANDGPFPMLMNSLFGSDGSRAATRGAPRMYQPRRQAAPLSRGYGRSAAPMQRQQRQAAPGTYSRSFNPRFERRVVSYNTGEKPGTIVIDKSAKYLYLVQGGGKAIRYGIGVGRPGFQWTGTHRITRKAEWPGWTPPPEMRKRQPWLPTHMEGGPANPLGARALYIGSTLYRVHGTNEPWTIGQEISSGCIRLRNEDIVHLYSQVKVGAKIKVY